MVSILLLMPTFSVGAKKPLIGTMDLRFDLDWFNDPGPHRPDWVGTITFEGDSNVYGMAFFVLGTGKPFATDPSPSVHFFQERYEIYEDVTLISFDDEPTSDTYGHLLQFIHGPLVLSGVDVGLTNLRNSKYHMTGNVDMADGYYFSDDWIGRKVFMSGDILWYDFGAPKNAPGTVRIH